MHFVVRGKSGLLNQFSGTAGVMAYHIESAHKTLAVMWYNPFDHIFHHNLWNVKLYSGHKEADETMYDTMYHSDPVKPDEFKKIHLGDDLKAEGAMSSTPEATLHIRVFYS